MKFQSQLILPTFICLFTANAALDRSAYAEGSKGFDGAQGVNRVVRSNSGAYASANSNATLSFHLIPRDGGLYNDKPSFYVGGTVGTDEIDAGLQFEPRTVGRYRPGWAAFISISHNGARAIFEPPKLTRRSDGAVIAWRGGAVLPAGTPMSSSITSEVSFDVSATGRVSATIGAMRNGGREEVIETDGIFFHTDSVAGNLNQATIKRVTAMTRSFGDSATDGSRISCTWHSSSFSPEMVDQSETGYDAPANSAGGLVLGPKDGEGNYKVDFPNLNISKEEARADSSASRSAVFNGVFGGLNSRYQNETVDINLRYALPRGFGLAGGR